MASDGDGPVGLFSHPRAQSPGLAACGFLKRNRRISAAKHGNKNISEAGCAKLALYTKLIRAFRYRSCFTLDLADFFLYQNQ